VVYNGYDLSYFDAPGDNGRLFKSHFGIYGDYMLNVANIEPRKNQLEFVKELRRSGVSRQLLIVGNIRDQAYWDVCQEVGGEQVRFMGPLEYASPEMISAISGAAIFVMPSTVETPSIAALEAFAMGTPLLITERGCTKEYFGDHAIYVDPDNLSDISVKLSSLNLMAPASRDERARFVWSNVIEDLISVYRTLSS